MVEIADIYHAYGYLWAVGHALHGAGSLRATVWVEALMDQLYLHGAAPVLAALATLAPTTEEAVRAITDAQTYVTRNVARMDDPRVVARQWPIGSGAAESSCTCVVEARLTQAGMRGGVPGSQAIASLRALHRSGRWAAFWQTHPDQYQPPTKEVSPLTPRGPAASAPRPAVTAASAVSATAPRVSARADTARTTPRPTPTRAQRPLLLPRSA